MLFHTQVEDLLKKQILEVEQWHKSLEKLEMSSPIKFSSLVSMQHQVNFELWHKEDLARDPEASDSKIASVKRAIDNLNQRRNDLIEQIDQFLVNYIKSENISANNDAEMNSETPGNIIDRLSINALKIYHMDEENKREGGDEKHIKRTKEKLSILLQQRLDLGKCLFKLLYDLYKGKKILKIYRQMKMYNDESLNPVLYSKK